MKLTQGNASKYVGCTITSNHPVFHYFPLKVKCFDGVFFVVDINGCAYEVPSEQERGLSISFDSVF